MRSTLSPPESAIKDATEATADRQSVSNLDAHETDADVSTCHTKLHKRTHTPSFGWHATYIVIWCGCAVPVCQNWLSSMEQNHWSGITSQIVTLLGLLAGYAYLRKTAPSSEPGISWAGLGTLAGMSIVHTLSAILALTKMHLFSFIGMTAALLWCLRGKRSFLHWLPLFLLAGFLAPEISDKFRIQISVPLQLMSTAATIWLGNFLIPIQGGEHVFYVKGVSYDVTTGCSGLNMWLTFIFSFMLWQVFQRCKPSGYSAAFALALLLAVVLNTLRLVITALLAYTAGHDVAMACHSQLELILVPIGMYAMWIVGRKFRAA